MGIRQTLNENPAVSIGITAAIIGLALIIIIWELVGGRRGAAPGTLQAFYSDDDGKTWFADDYNKIPPYKDSNGKTAVRAFVFRCKSGEPFVAYLQRYTDDGKKAMEEMNGQPGASRALAGQSNMIEVKKPGQSKWVPFDNEHPNTYNQIASPVCPDGSKDGLEMVTPASK